MSAPLEGLRVLDMTQYEAGTSSTQMLAWLGADVVKLESPQGDPGRQLLAAGPDDSQYFLNYNANKRSVVLDLKTADGRSLLLRLASRFDVFVENFGPGVIESLDINYEVMRKENPEIIYARIKGYGLSGPYSDWKCFDPLAQAAAGALSITGDPDGPPMKPGPTVADTGTGMQAALAITAAWASKLRTGKGQFIEVSMQETMTMFMRTTGVANWGTSATQRLGPRGSALSGMYPCAPGGPNDYVFMTIPTTRMWESLCTAIGREDLSADPRYSSAEQRSQNLEGIDAEIAKWTSQHSKFEAMRILCDGGVAASAVFDTMEVFEDPHLRSRGFVQQVQHPVQGDISLMRSPIRMPGAETELKAPPLLGADTAEVLASELGLTENEIEQLVATGAVRTSTPALPK